MFKLVGVKYKNIIDIEQLDIARNKVTCIMGGSGSGKTTLLRLLNHMISCDSGDIFLNNKNYNEIDSIKLRRSVVTLPQSPVIFPGNVKDNLQIGLKFSEKPEASEAELKSVLELVCLKKELDENADKLSGGEKQRLALGRIILMKPETLLLDEPSSALDDATEKVVIESVVNYVKHNGNTLVMVTHSKAIAQCYAQEIVELCMGRVVRHYVKNQD